MAFWGDNKDKQAHHMSETELHLQFIEGKV